MGSKTAEKKNWNKVKWETIAYKTKSRRKVYENESDAAIEKNCCKPQS